MNQTVEKIAVIYGGESSERSVSVRTKDSICRALDKLQKPYIAMELDKETPHLLVKENIGLVINAMHGKYGEDGRLPALLDIIKIPYTHSGFNTSQIGINKLLTKKLAEDIDIINPNYGTVHDINNISTQVLAIMQSPFVLKPISEGSSIGVHICLEPEKFELKEDHFVHGSLIIEEYIKGRELNVVVIDNKAIGIVEVKPKNLFYDYQAKYDSNDTEYIVSPELPKKTLKEILMAGERIHNYIGCNYVSRVEFLVKNGQIYFLEINTHPGFTESSLVPKVAKKFNIEFTDIVEGMIKSARFYD